MTGADLARILRAEFSGEIRRRLDGVAAAMTAGDADDVLRRAHMLKGAARTLQLADLAEAMEQIEDAYRVEPPSVQAARDALAGARVAVGAAEAQDVARLGHALRTPLNVVLGFAHLLRDSALPPEARAHADAIVRAAEQMAALIDEATVPTRSDEPATRTPATGHPIPRAAVTVLCIEDDPACARLVEELLSRIPAVRAVVAGTGSEGIELAGREHPDLVLLDPGLPDLSGAEALRALRHSVGDTAPLVIITGETRPDRLRGFRAAGAAACVTKPIDASRLLALVESARPPLSRTG